METSGVTPRGAVVAPDLAELWERPGPFLTAYVQTEAGIDNAAQRNEAKWRALRGDLDKEAVPAAALDLVDPLVSDAHHEGQALCVIASEHEVLHVEHHTQPLVRSVAWWDNLPRLGTVLEWRQRQPSYVIVVSDRTGADIIGVRFGRDEVHREGGGGEDPIRKVHPGGWSQRRFQQRAENVWDKNAHDVAGEVAKLAAQIDARLIVAAGDVRALQLLQESLPKELHDHLVTIEGQRATNGGEDEIASQVIRMVDTAVAADMKQMLVKLKEELGQGDRACEGAPATIDALARAQVDVLLVHDDPDDDRRAFFGEDPTQVGLTASAVEAFGGEPREGRLIDVAIRTAMSTSAGVRIVPKGGGPKDSIGAILRWS